MNLGSHSAWLMAATLIAAVASPLLSAADESQRDPAPSLKPPASMDEIKIPSNGNVLNGLIYLPAGAGSHPVVIFVHGYPGNERNLDLAQAMRRGGYAAVYFDYRGVFGTAGTFSHSHALEDVAAVLSWVRTPEIASKYHLDPTRVALVGHSFGGWLVLMSVDHEEPSVCVAAMAAWNGGWAKGRYPTHPDEAAESLEYYQVTTDGTGGPIHANPDELLTEGNDEPERWNYLSKVEVLKDRALLLAAATGDSIDEGVERHQELASAIRKQGGRRVRLEIFEDDHPFSSHRVALARTLLHWLQTDCASTQFHAAR